MAIGLILDWPEGTQIRPFSQEMGIDSDAPPPKIEEHSVHNTLDSGG